MTAASLTGRLACTTAATTSVMGISTPCLRARASTDSDDFTPSATWPLIEEASATDMPWPTFSPKVRFRDNGEAQVATRSPRPASPAEGLRGPAEGGAEPGDLRQPARDQHGPGVVTERHGHRYADGQGDDVLDRPAEFAPDHVGIGVRPEVGRVAGLLEPDRGPLVRTSHDGRRVLALSDLAGQVRPGDDADPGGRDVEHLGDDLTIRLHVSSSIPLMRLTTARQPG